MAEFGRGEGNDVGKETRWSAVLRQMDEASEDKGPWYRRVGVMFAWAAGIALGVGIATILILAVVDLFSPERMLNPTAISNWLFWAAALVLLSGLVAPSAQDAQQAAQDRQQKSRSRFSPVTQRASSTQQGQEEKQPLLQRLDERRERAVRRRMMRVYNPWQWRLWLSAVFCFGFAMLAGVFA